MGIKVAGDPAAAVEEGEDGERVRRLGRIEPDPDRAAGTGQGAVLDPCDRLRLTGQLWRPEHRDATCLDRALLGDGGETERHGRLQVGPGFGVERHPATAVGAWRAR